MTDFNWVQARAECSLVKVFELLKMQIEEDVKERNAQIPNTYFFGFSTVAQRNMISVILEGYGIQSKAVRFIRQEHAIQVEKDDEPLFSATLTLNNKGECRVKINSKEYELWEMRKMALEEMLFDLPGQEHI